MNRKWLIIWRIAALVVLLSIIPMLLICLRVDGQSYIVVLIWYALCIVLNIRMIWGLLKEEEWKFVITTILLYTLLAPILLFIKLIGSFFGGGGSYNYKSNEPRDTRSRGGVGLNSALERVVKNAVYSASKPSGSYLRYQSMKDYFFSPVTLIGKIKVSGTLVYTLSGYTPSSVESVRNDLENCLEQANRNILDAISEAVEKAREKYKDYDDEWDIEVDFGGEVR